MSQQKAAEAITRLVALIEPLKDTAELLTKFNSVENAVNEYEQQSDKARKQLEVDSAALESLRGEINAANEQVKAQKAAAKRIEKEAIEKADKIIVERTTDAQAQAESILKSATDELDKQRAVLGKQIVDMEAKIKSLGIMIETREKTLQELDYDVSEREARLSNIREQLSEIISKTGV